MSEKIIIAFDSFKGCLSAAEACHAANIGMEGIEIVELPLSDGGEGMLEVMGEALNGSMISVEAHGPLMEPCTAHYVIAGDGKTAVIEMAQTCGLTLVPEKKRNPELTTTYGLGEVIADALGRGCNNIIIGIGGSATNDAGTGMMQALGYFFIGKDEQDIFEPMCGKMLSNVGKIDETNVGQDVRDAKFTIICDVDNPLYGPRGAAHIYAPQKGANEEMVKRLDIGLKLYADDEKRANEKGAGAAGGMGYAFRRYMNATLKPGIEAVMDATRFDEKIKGASLIVTGEGRSDRQTLMGKVAEGVRQRAEKQKIDVALLSGAIEDKEMLEAKGFWRVRSINEGIEMAKEDLMRPDVARQNIASAIKKVIEERKIK